MFHWDVVSSTVEAAERDQGIVDKRGAIGLIGRAAVVPRLHEFEQRFPDIDLVAGNVATAEAPCAC